MDVQASRYNFSIKKITSSLLGSFALLTACTSAVHANDGAYYMSGNQLIPMHINDIDVTHEKLDIKKIFVPEITEEGYIFINPENDISVHYEMYNSGKAQKVIVGFEAMPPGGDANDCSDNGTHPYMKDFKVRVNGKSVPYKVTSVSLEDYENFNSKYIKTPPYFVNNKIQSTKDNNANNLVINCPNESQTMYVYYFDAEFKQGKNTIDHNYRFRASTHVLANYQLDYVLTAINRWGNGEVEDFELNIDLGDMQSFNLHNTFFDKASDWQLNGKIKAYPTPRAEDNYTDTLSTTFAVHDGFISFKKLNFVPKGELFLETINVLRTSDESFNANVDNIGFNYVYVNDDNVKANSFSQQVLRNFPFARRGYIFKNPKLQAYYAKQPWYIADKNYKADLSKLNKEEQDYVLKYSNK